MREQQMTREIFVPWLKKQADIASSLGILGGGLVALIMFFGGSFPPWYTPAQAQEAGRQSAQIQADTVAALDRLNTKMDRVEKRINAADCSSLNITLGQAQAALARSATDALARALRDTTQTQMRTIPGCAPF